MHVLSDIILFVDYGLLFFFFWRSLFFPLDYSTAHTLVTLSILRSVPLSSSSQSNTLLCTSIVIRTHRSTLVSVFVRRNE
jgi:hypothetical protein